jgi:hypothetical protein
MAKSNKLSKVIAPATAQVSAMPVNKTNEERERNYRAQSALSDIETAHKHMQNKDLMKDVKRVAKEKLKTLGKIAGKGD